MVILHLDTDGSGEAFFRAEKLSAEESCNSTVSLEELTDSVKEVVWYPEDVFLQEDGRVSVSQRNLLMFLSDVRERKFKEGIFLGSDILDKADAFRKAAGIVASGSCLPCIDVADGKFYGKWIALGESDPFVNRTVDSLMRYSKRSVLEGDAHRYDTVHDAWIASLRSDSGIIGWENTDEIEALSRQLAVWRSPLFVSPRERAALEFTLIEPEKVDGNWIVKISSVPSTHEGLVSLGQASSLFPPLRSFRGDRAEISLADAISFMRGGANLLMSAGYAVKVPESILGEHVFAEADIGEIAEENLTQREKRSGRKVFAAKISVFIDGVEVKEEDIAAILAQESDFVFFNDHWIEVDRARLREALRQMRNAESKHLRMHDAISMSLGYSASTSLKLKEARAHGWLRGILNGLKEKDKFNLIPVPEGLNATLRDYQLRGASWLDFLAKYGFGPCLADDMGLGKTIQTIAYLLHRKEKGELTSPALVVAPVSVVTNWRREFEKFAPSLKTYLHQGQFRFIGTEFVGQCRKHDVVITGYSLLVKDFKYISNVDFSVLVLDEAQMIKNPDTHYAKAACALEVPVKIALTGTPVENSPDDLWSIENCLNPGLLGERKEFSKKFSERIATDARSGMAAKLRHIVEPFMLRRMKNDKKIAAEIGEKYEIREYCPLSRLQRRMYEDALNSFREDVAAGEELSGIARRGRMFALLTELKEICDAPELVEEGGDVTATGGKIARLKDLLENIFGAGESVLIFTQYVRMGKLLRKFIQDSFGRRVPFLHGGLSSKDRDAEIESFNSSREPSAFILSLKAGGFGLNLTKATHVIHFDRWWNPAVENQATDRAYRIGQTKTVFVHTFICPGTLEDRIDALLESKRHLVNEIVAGGESFLLKMGTEEFERMVKLDG